MKTDGTGYSTVKTEDGTESKVNVPLGADFNMNEDASISISQTLSSGSQLSTNISSVGEVTVGVDSSGSGPNVKAPKGSEVTISDLLMGLIVQSGNDAAIVLAEGIAGSEEEFAILMTSKAKELGLSLIHI